jgi:hypothetical protein
MLRRTLILVVVLALLVPSAAFAQGGAFGPLPQAAPESTATPQQSNDSNSQDLGGRTTLYIIFGGLLIAFVAIGVFISRDARRSTPKHHRGDPHRLREQGPHKHKMQAKSRARAKTKAQREARRRNR